MDNLIIRKGRLLAALLAGLLPITAYGVDAVLTDDAYVYTSKAGNNYGAQTVLNVDGKSRTFLQFSLDTLPVGTTPAQIAKATLHVWVNRLASAGNVQLALVNSEWSEASVTQNRVPGEAGAFASVPVSQAGQWVSVDLTDTVKQWIDYPDGNYGLAIAPAVDIPAAVSLDSKENTGTSHPPRLEIVLAGPQGPEGPQGPMGLQGEMGPQGLQGVAGQIGPTGPTGPQGPAGLTGATGQQGPIGLTGPQGLQGPIGQTGATGLQGTQGIQGIQGPMGPQGPVGSTGPQGPAGVSTLAGDVTGDASATMVARLQGRAMSNSTPADGDLLHYSGGQWRPGLPSSLQQLQEVLGVLQCNVPGSGCGGGRVYVSNRLGNSISVIDPASNTVISTIALSRPPIRMALHPAGHRLYVVTENSNLLTVIDTTNGTSTDVSIAGGNLFDVAVQSNGSRLYVANGIGVVELDAGNLSEVARINGLSGSLALALDASRSRLYVASLSRIYIVNSTSRSVIDQLGVDLGNGRVRLALNPAGTRLNAFGVEVNYGRVTHSARIEVNPASVAIAPGPVATTFSPTGQLGCLESGDANGQLSCFESASGQVQFTRTEYCSATNCYRLERPVGAAVNSAGNRIYVANTAFDQVWIVDSASGDVIAAIPVGNEPQSIVAYR